MRLTGWVAMRAGHGSPQGAVRRIAGWLIVAVMLAPVPAAGTLAAFVPGRDGWAVSADTAASVGDGVVCGYYSKLIATEAAIGMIGHLNEGPVYERVRRGIVAVTGPPTIEDLRALQAAGLRHLAALPVTVRREHRGAAAPDGTFMVVHVATVGDGALRFVEFGLGISADLQPLSHPLRVVRLEPEAPPEVEVAGWRSFFVKHVQPTVGPELIAPLRERRLRDIGLETAATVSRRTVEAAIKATYTLAPVTTGNWIGVVGGPVETVTVTAREVRWLARLPASLRDARAAAQSCAAHATRDRP